MTVSRRSGQDLGEELGVRADHAQWPLVAEQRRIALLVQEHDDAVTACWREQTSTKRMVEDEEQDGSQECPKGIVKLDWKPIDAGRLATSGSSEGRVQLVQGQGPCRSSCPGPRSDGAQTGTASRLLRRCRAGRACRGARRRLQQHRTDPWSWSRGHQSRGVAGRRWSTRPDAPSPVGRSSEMGVRLGRAMLHAIAQLLP